MATEKNKMDLHPIFKDCLLDERTRYAIDIPFVQSGYVYATDGRIIVRQKSDEPDTMPPEGMKFPTGASLFWDAEPYTSIPTPQVAIESKVTNDDCDDCFGEPIQMADCETCLKTGKVKVTQWPRFRIADNAAIGGKYLAIIQRHGVASIGLVAAKGHRDNFRFSLGDIEGLLMGAGAYEDWADGAIDIRDMKPTVTP